jgi:hypothetical protein
MESHREITEIREGDSHREITEIREGDFHREITEIRERFHREFGSLKWCD